MNNGENTTTNRCSFDEAASRSDTSITELAVRLEHCQVSKEENTIRLIGKLHDDYAIKDASHQQHVAWYQATVDEFKSDAEESYRKATFHARLNLLMLFALLLFIGLSIGQFQANSTLLQQNVGLNSHQRWSSVPLTDLSDDTQDVDQYIGMVPEGQIFLASPYNVYMEYSLPESSKEFLFSPGQPTLIALPAGSTIYNLKINGRESWHGYVTQSKFNGEFCHLNELDPQAARLVKVPVNCTI